MVAEFEGVLIVPREQARAVLERAEAIVTAESKGPRRDPGGGSPSGDSLDRHGHI